MWLRAARKVRHEREDGLLLTSSGKLARTRPLDPNSLDPTVVATIGSLSSEPHVDLSTMSRNSSVLERNGYLMRTRSDDDDRIVHVTLTAKGTRALETLCCSERDVLKDIFDRLPASERPRVLKGMEILRACIAPLGAGEEACCVPPARKSAS